RDHARAADIDEAERHHQIDEGADLLGAAGQLEYEALDRRIDDAGAKDVGDTQALDTLLAGSGHLDEGELALDMRPLDAEIAYRMDGHEARQLRLDLLDDHRRAGGHDGDARQV